MRRLLFMLSFVLETMGTVIAGILDRGILFSYLCYAAQLALVAFPSHRTHAHLLLARQLGLLQSGLRTESAS